MNGLGATQKKESPGETKQNAFDAIIELISTKCMGLLPQRLGNRAQIRRKSSLGLGAVICLVSYQLIRRKASHAHERRRGERKIVLVGKYDLMRLWHEVGGLKSPLKCLTQDHTMANARPRMEADYNVCFNVPRTKKRLDAFANSRSCSRFEKRKTTSF